jgi:hypothetical protein
VGTVRLRLFKNRELERMLSTEIEKATSGLRILHNFQILIKLDYTGTRVHKFSTNLRAASKF